MTYTDKAVILARGLGTRMRKTDGEADLDAKQAAAADTGIKALIPIDRPFLDYVLHVLAESGYRRICLVIGPEHHHVRDYYGKTLKPQRLEISFAVQEDPNGTADAVAAAEAFAANDPFLMINSDNHYPRAAVEGLRKLTTPGLAGFDRENLIAQSNIPADRIAKFAVIKATPDGYMQTIIEKPDEATLKSLGDHVLLSMNCWLFHTPIFRACTSILPSSRGEFEITDAVQYAIDHLGQKFRVLAVNAPVLDMSSRRDIPAIAARLAGTEVRLCNENVAQRKAALLARRQTAIAGTGDNSEKNGRRFFVPGRIEFLGKHTDYAGGRSLLCTVERGICLVTRPRGDLEINLAALDLNDHAAFPFASDIQPRAGHWSNYPMTVARRIARNFPGHLRGADIAFASDLPHAAGMSSSSALVIAIFLALSTINNLPEHPGYRAHIRSAEDLAGFLGCIENGQSFGNLAGDRGVGTFGGSQDHTAILCSRPDQLVQYSFCPVRDEATLPFPADYVLAIGVSGVVSEKTGPAMEEYNRAAQRAAEIVNLWRSKTGGAESTLAAILASSFHAPHDLRTILREAQSLPEFATLRLTERLEQFDAEANRIIPDVAAALRASRIDLIGPLVDESQRNAETLLGNQVPETIALCRIARELCAPAASAFGAGFGGAVWALIPEKDSAVFLADWKLRYHAAFPARSVAAGFFITHPGPPA